jgi:hypothetical protein
MSRNEAEEAVPAVSFIPRSLGYINGIQIGQVWINDRLSSIHLKV